MIISDRNNLYIHLNKLNNKNITIFGKGPTFKNIEKNKNAFFICINQALNHIDNPDMFVFNDIETLDFINYNKLKLCDYILCPVYPHYNCKFHKNYSYINVIKKIRNHFTGTLLLYNLHTAINQGFKINQYITFKKNHLIMSSGITSLLFCEEILKKNIITTYGITLIKKTDKYYNDKFTQKDYNNGFINSQIKNASKIINPDFKIIVN